VEKNTPLRSPSRTRRCPSPSSALQELLLRRVALEDGEQELLHDLGGRARLEHLAELVAELVGGPPEVHLEDLPDVHARGHAEGVEHHVDGVAAGQVRHVLLGEDARHDALVAVAAGHLVAHLQLALDGDVDLHHLDDARRELVALGEALDLLGAVLLDGGGALVELLEDVAQLGRVGVVEGDLRPELARDRLERRLVDGRALGEEHLAALVDELGLGGLVEEERARAAEVALADDLDLVVAVLLEAGALLVLDVLGAVVLLGALAREDARVDHDARDARRDAQRGVAHVAGLLAEDRAQELLLGGELRLALRGDLAHEDVARLHLGADAHDARLVEVLEGLLADVGDVAGDLLLAELGVARDALELLDVHAREDVLLGDLLGDEDRVLEVVPAPGHERDEHVRPERELAGVRGGAVGQHVTDLDPLARADDGLLVPAGVLVRALVLGEVVDVRLFAALALRADHDAGRVGGLDHARARASTHTPESRAT
jgi:hypothetical protein